MEILDENLSRLNLLVIVSEIMNIPEKTFKKWEKTHAPTATTRESLLVDTLIAKGFRQCDFSKKTGENTCDT